MKHKVFVLSALGFALFLSNALLPAKSPRKQLNLVIAHTQQGSPVSLDSVTHGNEFLFDKAGLKNISDRTVRSVTFGVILRESGAANTEPMLISQREIQTNLKPNEERSVDVLDAPVQEVRQKAESIKSNPAVVEFGILEVRFSDGTFWNFDLKGTGRFVAGNGS